MKVSRCVTCSRALFPIRGDVPSWLQIASGFNPLTYGVDALRTVVLDNAWQPLHPLYYNLLLICAFDAVMMTIGTLALSRRR